mmetsp:Transcript_30348/g.99004  ORF Transcript_30348/g.99004 Transcript_30348/m.99004 type:complete len:214 (+) Transcript_30348:261-902(+)
MGRSGEIWGDMERLGPGLPALPGAGRAHARWRGGGKLLHAHPVGSLYRGAAPLAEQPRAIRAAGLLRIGPPRGARPSSAAHLQPRRALRPLHAAHEPLQTLPGRRLRPRRLAQAHVPRARRGAAPRRSLLAGAAGGRRLFGLAASVRRGREAVSSGRVQALAKPLGRTRGGRGSREHRPTAPPATETMALFTGRRLGFAVCAPPRSSPSFVIG